LLQISTHSLTCDHAIAQYGSMQHVQSPLFAWTHFVGFFVCSTHLLKTIIKEA